MSDEQLIDKGQKCTICDTKNILVSCRNCRHEMCSFDSCGIHFDHIHNELYSICNTCVDKISKKIVLSVDYSKLMCLKKKIKLRKMFKS
jgi:hypothetical protein